VIDHDQPLVFRDRAEASHLLPGLRIDGSRNQVHQPRGPPLVIGLGFGPARTHSHRHPAHAAAHHSSHPASHSGHHAGPARRSAALGADSLRENRALVEQVEGHAARPRSFWLGARRWIRQL